jgi:hypothetical protein
MVPKNENIGGKHRKKMCINRNYFWSDRSLYCKYSKFIHLFLWSGVILLKIFCYRFVLLVRSACWILGYGKFSRKSIYHSFLLCITFCNIKKWDKLDHFFMCKCIIIIFLHHLHNRYISDISRHETFKPKYVDDIKEINSWGLGYHGAGVSPYSYNSHFDNPLRYVAQTLRLIHHHLEINYVTKN